jgi:hypothetical protein
VYTISSCLLDEYSHRTVSLNIVHILVVCVCVCDICGFCCDDESRCIDYNILWTQETHDAQKLKATELLRSLFEKKKAVTKDQQMKAGQSALG